MPPVLHSPWAVLYAHWFFTPPSSTRVARNTTSRVTVNCITDADATQRRVFNTLSLVNKEAYTELKIWLLWITCPPNLVPLLMPTRPTGPPGGNDVSRQGRATAPQDFSGGDAATRRAVTGRRPGQQLVVTGAELAARSPRNDTVLLDYLRKHGLNSYGQIVRLVSRNVTVYSEKLRDVRFLEREFHWLQNEARLRGRLNAQSYVAAHAMRMRVRQLTGALLPRHAQELDVKVCMDRRNAPRGVSAGGLEDAADTELDFWMKWRREYGEHPTFGTVCLSVTCDHKNFCVSARKRQRQDDDDPLDPGSNAGGAARVTTTFLVPPPPRAGGVHPRAPVTVADLPDEVWPSILEYAFGWNGLASLAALYSSSVFFRGVISALPQAPLVTHYRTAEQLREVSRTRFLARARDGMLWQAPCSETYDAFSHLLAEVVHAYTGYVNVYYQLRYTTEHFLTDERHALLDDFLHFAVRYGVVATCVPASDGESFEKKRLERVLADLDYRLLEMFALDVLRLKDECVHALPPRAFYQRSKHQRNYRRQFTDPDAYTSHRGARLLHTLHGHRDDLKQQRRVLYRALRAVEAFEVTHVQRLTDDVYTTGFVQLTASHPCARLTSTCNSLLTFNELDVFCDRLVVSAEDKTSGTASHSPAAPSSTNKYDAVRAVLDELRRTIASRISDLVSNLFSIHTFSEADHEVGSSGGHGGVRVLECGVAVVPGGPATICNWRLFMSTLLAANSTKRRRSRRRTVSIRLTTGVTSDRGELSTGFSVCYEEFVGSRVSSWTAATARASEDDDDDDDGYVRAAPADSTSASASASSRTRLSELISYGCLGVHALTPGHRRRDVTHPSSPPLKHASSTRATSADIVITWRLGHPASVAGPEDAPVGEGENRDGGAAVPVIVFRDTTPRTYALWHAFIETEGDVLSALKQHASLTGKCAPCGRSLTRGNPWFGTTCAGHLPDPWREKTTRSNGRALRVETRTGETANADDDTPSPPLPPPPPAPAAPARHPSLLRV